MAYDETQVRVSYDADASIGIYTGVPGMPGSPSPSYGKQFCFVKLTGEHTAGLCTNATNELCEGVLQNKPQYPGDASSVAISGISLVMVGAVAVTAGEAVKSDANGNAVAATVGTDRVLGTVVRSAAAGSLAPVRLRIY